MNTIVFENNIYVVKTDGVAVGYFQDVVQAETFFYSLINASVPTIEQARAYDVCSFKLFQTIATDPPEMLLLENTCGSFTVTRDGIGVYSFSNSAITTLNTMIFINEDFEWGQPLFATIKSEIYAGGFVIRSFVGIDPEEFIDLANLSNYKLHNVEVRIYR